MKLNSPLFDRIRVKPADDRRHSRPTLQGCQWPGCAAEGTHKAPKGRHQEGQYWQYCLDHVREYNHSYNYFSGMTDDAVCAYQKDALTGHRPTWKMGAKGSRTPGPPPPGGAEGMRDPFGFTAEMGGAFHADRPVPDGRIVRTTERRALEVMGLEMSAGATEIKARYKELVKLHHPDANGGDRSSEDRLRSVIQAYNNLKQAGFC
ncbi:J domain-containing protein [Xanthobacter dioxanivorans]|uniref:J domain-containing protein n=1 Tax=Xanthobacter dioxanivorans TaxID=2528964 RepID=A0A974SJB8_9HYPH|nr:J domain-containing protein [Xanthobacter dioxanivorans]QRG08231.1 J domain-containing protein [Xanthobacter dioxanivorans]